MAYQLDARRHVRDQQLTGETVILSEGECAGLVESTLTDGTLKLAQAKGAAIISFGTLKTCRVIAVKRQRDFDFFSARFIECTFEGTYSGISFGNRGGADELLNFGTVQACDFSSATLDGCRFFNVDVSTLRFPAWPHVVLLDFSKRAHEVAAATWPGELGSLMRICADQPDSVRATVVHVPSFAKLVACTEEQVRDAFEKFGRLVM